MNKFAENLSPLKGIGEKTIEDLNRIYRSEEELIAALKNDLVPFHDNVVELLRKHYKI